MDLFNEFANSLEAADATRERQQRKLRRSCELCRNSKGKCCPSKDDESRCQRCVKERKECVFLQTKPRPKRAKNSRIRVAEMEEKINGIYSLLATNRPLLEGATPPLPPSTLPLPEPSSSSRSSSQISIQPSIHPPFSTTYQLPSVGFGQLQDVITKGLLTFEEAEDGLEFFRTQAHRFPFVIVSPRETLDSLRREKPFLLLAILTFATKTRPKLQAELELELRESLSKRVVVNMEKSLDILQGLLVYLAWYHLYIQPERESVYQTLQMAVSMAIDLGINKPPLQAIPSEHDIVPNLRVLFASRVRISAEELESRRAFLGCYYLSSALGQGLRKPGNLNYSDYVGESCQILTTAAEAETDHLLQYFIRLQKFASEVNQAFDYDNVLSHSLPPLDAAQVEVLAKRFNHQLNQIKAEFPKEVWTTNGSLTNIFFNLRIYVNEIGFHSKPPSRACPNSTSRSFHTSPLRYSLLVCSLRNTQEFLSHYISQSPDSLLSSTLIDTLSLIYAILILGSFATSPPSIILPDAQYLHYMDALMAKLGSLMTEESGEEIVYHMMGFCRKSKAWYEQKIGERERGRDDGGGRMDTSFMEILPTVLSRCIDFWTKADAEREMETESDEMRGESEDGNGMWTDMLGNWPVGMEEQELGVGMGGGMG